MGKRKGNRGLTILLVVLILALAAVIAVIFIREREYAASASYYESLRGSLRTGGLCG